jgi:hypothetical protein
MNRDEMIRMAVQCQLVTTGNRDGVYIDALERFAALVSAAEREECANLAAWILKMPENDVSAAIRARGM